MKKSKQPISILSMVKQDMIKHEKLSSKKTKGVKYFKRSTKFKFKLKSKKKRGKK